MKKFEHILQEMIKDDLKMEQTVEETYSYCQISEKDYWRYANRIHSCKDVVNIVKPNPKQVLIQYKKAKGDA